MFKPRPAQAEILQYRSGKMGIAAVPGSGKTATLSYLAARLIADVGLQDDQEILIVTLVNSAVGNFQKSLAKYLRDAFGLLPRSGYRVRTLHGLANDIVRERPGLVGLADDFDIVDERASLEILRDAADAWVRTHPDFAEAYLHPEYAENTRTHNQDWPKLVLDTANSAIRLFKDWRLTVADLQRDYPEPDRLPLAQMCIGIYAQYERSLRYRGAVDFQDLIRLALEILLLDEHYLQRLRQRWPYVLEDEAQDSSALQEQILRQLVGPSGNWVRVGDPNQAIFETFTTASPRFLRGFLAEAGVIARELPNSGRSTASIIALANHLIQWSAQHPNATLRALQPLGPPLIEPTPPNDPQGNPPDAPELVRLQADDYTPDSERDAVVKSLRHWLAQNPDKTCAVLLPINSSGTKLVDVLRKEGVPYVENLRSTSNARAVIGTLYRVLAYLAQPMDGKLLADVYRVWRRDDRGDDAAEQNINALMRQFRQLGRVEDYLAPRLTDWLQQVAQDNDALVTHLEQFRTLILRWQAAADLPIDQLILTIGGDLLQQDSDIAVAYSAALNLRDFAERHPQARLPDYAQELAAIAKGQRKFSGVSDDDLGFDPDQHRGKVTVTTMHKAKGLEWDRVYILSVNNYSYPSAQVGDQYIGEKWFIRDKLNLEAEAHAQIRALIDHTEYQEGAGTQAERLAYAAERLRLLYVGITRARRELVITWNTGRKGNEREALPLAALRGWWSQYNAQY